MLFAVYPLLPVWERPPAPAGQFYTVVIGGLAIAMVGRVTPPATVEKDVGCARLCKGTGRIFYDSLGKD